ncbi:exonuclease DPD1, chloroplastic/mitochondrial [Impatiens glandulifera]|uniref:exonuclease DPD1, chloroplastic/mitochondrial n=1 Tax=Impatiens glandulifera TaxID=253017 RepID=UPI001FB1150F|nr:exonuclease DPD1, chloroplastic/mitochondrial [Impatiens glandulifera]
MRTVAMCLSILPRCRIHSFASSCLENSQRHHPGNRISLRFLSSKTLSSLEGGEQKSKKWTRKSIMTNTEGLKGDGASKSKISNNIKYNLSVETTDGLNVEKSETRELDIIQNCDVQQKMIESEELARLVTVISFDLETSGLNRSCDCVIEMAMQDLAGGKNSTFQTLVNPDCVIKNSEFHGITTDMVNQPHVPRMKDLIPILLAYVKSRQKPGGIVLLVAHNGRNFDVPFLINEFNRNNFDIPHDWHFLDTLPLAREVMKSKVAELKSAKISLSLQSMREYYNIAPIGSAHRAMSDVNTLSQVFQRMTFDLKLPTSGLIERSFRQSDLVKTAKKTSQARPKKC